MVAKRKNKRKKVTDLAVYTGRDVLFLRIVQGVTKAAVHVDRKKKSNKNKCRTKVKETEE